MGTHQTIYTCRVVDDDVWEVRLPDHWPKFYGFMEWLGCYWRNNHRVPPLQGVFPSTGRAFEDAGLTHDDPEVLYFRVHLQILLDFDYSQVFEDRRVYNGGETCAPGQGVKVTYREFFGPRFFDMLKLCEQSSVTELWYTFT